MNVFLLTQDDGALIGWITRLLGKIMDVIFNGLDMIGIANVGVAIIIFTIIINLFLLPLTLKQQKFSKLNAKINPEIQAIRDKYKGKQDQQSQMAMNQEVQMVYAKYGVSPTGSCVQLLIQMPILLALYRVIASMPAYVTKMKDAFMVLANKIVEVDGGKFITNSEVSTIQNTVRMYGQHLTDDNLHNGIIDVLNKLSSTDMGIVAEHYGLSGLQYQGQLILSNDVTAGLIDTYNSFLGLNIANAPSHILKSAWAAGAWGLVIGALAIPLLSALTQWISVKLMPQQDNGNKKSSEESAMESSLKTMNTIMPIMSAWFCFTLPCGMGIYWIAGSVVRGIIQIICNKHFDRIDFEDLIKKNEVKSAKKLEKMKQQQEMMAAYANMNTKKIQNNAGYKNPANSSNSNDSNNTTIKTNYTANAKPGSMMAKANMVKEYNERNNKN
ncbi:MAG: membrane protein insertase YidC [Lachnospiraceae bacterium]|nr:membrane protein insertase YidC [Lachnospiraceae bacterium]